MSHASSGSGAQRSDSERFAGPLPLVGRTRELAVLEALIEGPDRAASLVLVSGEGGVGKSRLVAELAGRAETRGWDVVRGRAYPVERGVPYALFSDAFLPLLGAMDPDTLTVLSRGGETELSYLFPALAAGRDEDVDAAGSDPEEFRTRLMWNFAEFLKNYSSRSPLLVVLEDLQWADESSLHLLHFLARQAGEQSLVLIGTYNDSDRDRSPQLVKTERSLLSFGAAEVLPLAPLSREQVTELVCRAFTVDAEQVGEFSAMLFGWTQGNAFFLEEIIKALVANGRISSKQGVWIGWDADDFSLPRTIREAVLGRIEPFSDDARTVAELAAVIGTRASYPLLEAISGLPQAALLSALEELCAHLVLKERVEAGAVVYDFAHPLVQQTLYGEFGLQRARGSCTGLWPKRRRPSTAPHRWITRTSWLSTSPGPTRGTSAARQRAISRRRAGRRWSDARTRRR